jgi:hypothetical protein
MAICEVVHNWINNVLLKWVSEEIHRVKLYDCANIQISSPRNNENIQTFSPHLKCDNFYLEYVSFWEYLLPNVGYRCVSKEETKFCLVFLVRRSKISLTLKSSFIYVTTLWSWRRCKVFFLFWYKGCFFKFRVEVGVEESIVNEPLVLKTLIFQTAG